MSIQPLHVLDKCIGERVWILMKNKKEFVGLLKGFDEYMHIVLEDVKEYKTEINNNKFKGELVKEIKTILLNGNGIEVIIPGSEPEYN